MRRKSRLKYVAEKRRAQQIKLGKAKDLTVEKVSLVKAVFLIDNLVYQILCVVPLIFSALIGIVRWNWFRQYNIEILNNLTKDTGTWLGVSIAVLACVTIQFRKWLKFYRRLSETQNFVFLAYVGIAGCLIFSIFKFSLYEAIPNSYILNDELKNRTTRIVENSLVINEKAQHAISDLSSIKLDTLADTSRKRTGSLIGFGRPSFKVINHVSKFTIEIHQRLGRPNSHSQTVAVAISVADTQLLFISKSNFKIEKYVDSYFGNPYCMRQLLTLLYAYDYAYNTPEIKHANKLLRDRNERPNKDIHYDDAYLYFLYQTLQQIYGNDPEYFRPARSWSRILDLLTQMAKFAYIGYILSIFINRISRDDK